MLVILPIRKGLIIMENRLNKTGTGVLLVCDLDEELAIYYLELLLNLKHQK